MEVMVHTNPFGYTDTQMHTRTHAHTPKCHYGDYALLATSRLNKNACYKHFSPFSAKYFQKLV